MKLYQKAKKLLKAEYERNFEIVKDSLYHKSYANEKIRHSVFWRMSCRGFRRLSPFFVFYARKRQCRQDGLFLESGSFNHSRTNVLCGRQAKTRRFGTFCTSRISGFELFQIRGIGRHWSKFQIQSRNDRKKPCFPGFCGENKEKAFGR